MKKVNCNKRECISLTALRTSCVLLLFCVLVSSIDRIDAAERLPVGIVPMKSDVFILHAHAELSNHLLTVWGSGQEREIKHLNGFLEILQLGADGRILAATRGAYKADLLGTPPHYSGTNAGIIYFRVELKPARGVVSLLIEHVGWH